MKIKAVCCVLFLTACSSPPEPPQIDWHQQPDNISTELMDWQPTQGIMKSEQVNSSWKKVIRNFVPENRVYDDAVFYAVAHSREILVECSNGSDFFAAKNWLRSNGATGVIKYASNKNCISCRSVNVYLIR